MARLFILAAAAVLISSFSGAAGCEPVTPVKPVEPAEPHCGPQHLENGCKTDNFEFPNSCKWTLPDYFSHQTCLPIETRVVTEKFNGGSKMEFACPPSEDPSAEVYIGFEFAPPARSISWYLEYMNGKLGYECFMCREDGTWREDSSDSYGLNKTWTHKAECVYRHYKDSSSQARLAAAGKKVQPKAAYVKIDEYGKRE